MGAYMIRRFLLMILTLFGMSVLIFVMLRLVPGNIADIVFEAAGMDSERARALYDWGQHAIEGGDSGAGLPRIDEARAIFDRLGMTFERDAAARPA